MTGSELRKAVSKKPSLLLRGQPIALFLGTIATGAVLVQLLLGASPLVVLWAVISAATGLSGFAVLGAFNLGSWIALFYALGNVLIAIYAKTLFFQPLGSYLYAPLSSFVSLAVSSIGLLAALLLVRRIKLGAPLLRPVFDTGFLTFLSWTCFGMGAFFWMLNNWFHDSNGSGFGGIAIFRDLLLMAVIARTAMLLEGTKDHRAFDISLAVILAVSISIGLMSDSKALTALPVVSYFATVLFYRGRIPVHQLAVVLVGGILFVSVLAPMIHALRAIGKNTMSLEQRIEFIVSNVTGALEAPTALNRLERIASSQFLYGYYNYFGENGAGQMLLGRYASVQQIDPVIAEVDHEGTVGGSAIWGAFRRQMPGVLCPQKPKYGEPYQILVHYGLIDPSGGKFPTLPLAGQAYAAYGVLGLLTVPFLTFFTFLLVIKKLGWQLYRNVYAIFFFCDFVIVYVSQGDLGQYVAAAFRDFPLFAGTFLVIRVLYRIRIRRRLSERLYLFAKGMPRE